MSQASPSSAPVQFGMLHMAARGRVGETQSNFVPGAICGGVMSL